MASVSSLMLASLVLLHFLLGSVLAQQQQQQPSKQDYAITSIPGLPASIPINNQYSGFLNVPNAVSGSVDQLFFWYVGYQGTSTTNSNNLIIWLNGGPGCSSLVGMWLENGPITFLGSGNFSANPYSWASRANVLYVEQPVGTGFGGILDTVNYPKNETQVAQTFTVFLKAFYTVFPETESMQLYLAGESYAGRYIPFIANILLASPSTFLLKGVTMGGPFIANSQNSNGVYAQYLVETGISPAASDKGHQNFINQCVQAYESADFMAQTYCYAQLAQMQMSLNGTISNGYMFNPYNFKQDYRDSLTRRSNLAGFMSLANVQTSIHAAPAVAAGSQWTACSSIVAQLQFVDDATSLTMIQNVLNAGVPVVIYSGDLDFVCNHIGIEAQISSMSWMGSTGFSTAFTSMKDWSPSSANAVVAGKMISERGLTYIRVREAGHMVPNDQPAAALGLVDHILSQPLQPSCSNNCGAKSGPSTGVIVGVLFVIVLIVGVAGFVLYRYRNNLVRTKSATLDDGLKKEERMSATDGKEGIMRGLTPPPPSARFDDGSAGGMTAAAAVQVHSESSEGDKPLPSAPDAGYPSVQPSIEVTPATLPFHSQPEQQQQQQQQAITPVLHKVGSGASLQQQQQQAALHRVGSGVSLQQPQQQTVLHKVGSGTSLRSQLSRSDVTLQGSPQQAVEPQAPSPQMTQVMAVPQQSILQPMQQPVFVQPNDVLYGQQQAMNLSQQAIFNQMAQQQQFMQQTMFTQGQAQQLMYLQMQQQQQLQQMQALQPMGIKKQVSAIQLRSTPTISPIRQQEVTQLMPRKQLSDTELRAVPTATSVVAQQGTVISQQPMGPQIPLPAIPPTPAQRVSPTLAPLVIGGPPPPVSLFAPAVQSTVSLPASQAAMIQQAPTPTFQPVQVPIASPAPPAMFVAAQLSMPLPQPIIVEQQQVQPVLISQPELVPPKRGDSLYDQPAAESLVANTGMQEQQQIFGHPTVEEPSTVDNDDSKSIITLTQDQQDSNNNNGTDRDTLVLKPIELNMDLPAPVALAGDSLADSIFSKFDMFGAATNGETPVAPTANPVEIQATGVSPPASATGVAAGMYFPRRQ